jgi:hypothetical protein
MVRASNSHPSVCQLAPLRTFYGNDCFARVLQEKSSSLTLFFLPTSPLSFLRPLLVTYSLHLIVLNSNVTLHMLVLPTGLPLSHYRCCSKDHAKRAQQDGPGRHRPRKEEGMLACCRPHPVLVSNSRRDFHQTIKLVLRLGQRVCPDLPADGQIFDAEAQSFFLLFNRFLTERAKGEKL